MLAYVVQFIKNPNVFLAKVEYLYRHPAETSRDDSCRLSVAIIKMHVCRSANVKAESKAS